MIWKYQSCPSFYLQPNIPATYSVDETNKNSSSFTTKVAELNFCKMFEYFIQESWPKYQQKKVCHFCPGGPGRQCGPGDQGCPCGQGGPGGLGGPGRPDCQCGPGGQGCLGGQGGHGHQVCQYIWFTWSKQSDN